MDGIKEHVERVSFAGGVIKTIAKSVEHTNIFDTQQASNLISDETLRKYRMAEDAYRRGRGKKISISVPEGDSEHHKEIRRRQTGFMRSEDITRMRQFERKIKYDDDDISDDFDLDDDYLPYTRQISIQSPSAMAAHNTGIQNSTSEAIHGMSQDEIQDEIKQQIEKRPSTDPYGPKVDPSATVPKVLPEPVKKRSRESPGGVMWKSGSNFRATRFSDSSDESQIDDLNGKQRMSVLTRLIDDVAITHTHGPGPILKNYKALSEQQQKNSLFLLTYSREKYLDLNPNRKDDARELYLRRHTPITMNTRRPQDKLKSIDHILGLQHGTTGYRKISTDYVKTIDQIETMKDISIRALEYAKNRPSISVKEYKKRNREYNERLATLSKHSKDDVHKKQE